LSRPHRPGIGTTNGVFGNRHRPATFFSTVEAQGANDRFQVRDRDGAMTEMGAQQTSRREPDNVGFPPILSKNDFANPSAQD
jgi:hypothetical protein